jgi:DNA mismatch repair protein MutS
MHHSFSKLKFLESPSVCYETIEERLRWIDVFYNDSALRREIRGLLKPIKDIERSLQRIQLNRGSPRDLSAISESVVQAAKLTQRLNQVTEEGDTIWKQRIQTMPNVIDLSDMLQRALKDVLPFHAEEGDFIRDQ